MTSRVPAHVLDPFLAAAEAAAAARSAWAASGLSSIDEARLQARFAGSLTVQDHDARVDRLLADRQATAASRMLAWASPARRAAFGARIAMQLKQPDAESRVLALGPTANADAGVLMDRARWLRDAGRSVEARNLDTNQGRTLATEGDGRFVFLQLPPGNYRVTFTLSGFATTVHENVLLTVGQSINLLVAMKVSGVAETVTVTTGTPVIDTSRTAAATTIDQATIDTIPILGRKFEDLLTLTPGVSVVQGPDGDEVISTSVFEQIRHESQRESRHQHPDAYRCPSSPAFVRTQHDRKDCQRRYGDNRTRRLPGNGSIAHDEECCRERRDEERTLENPWTARNDSF